MDILEHKSEEKGYVKISGGFILEFKVDLLDYKSMYKIELERISGLQT